MAKKTAKHHFIVILCGGTGPRLWPLSNALFPKQFLKILSPQSLLENTISRCLKIVDKSHLVIVSNYKYKKLLVKLPGIILLEPHKRNTTPAILYATSYIKKIDPLATITTTPADHFIRNTLLFTADIKKAVTVANLGKIVSIGVVPNSANPSYGYIKTKDQHSPSKVLKFIEKPLPIKAARFIKNKQWFWNTGIYTFTIKVLEHTLRLHSPKFFKIYHTMCFATNNSTLNNIYINCPSRAFDKTVSERTHNMEMLSASFDWSDVGQWNTIYLKSNKDRHQNALLNTNTNLIALDSHHCLINGPKNKLIGLIGVNNLSIIDTPLGLLVCRLDLSDHVRDLVATIVADPKYKNFFLKS